MAVNIDSMLLALDFDQYHGKTVEELRAYVEGNAETIIRRLRQLEAECLVYYDPRNEHWYVSTRGIYTLQCQLCGGIKSALGNGIEKTAVQLANELGTATLKLLPLLRELEAEGKIQQAGGEGPHALWRLVR